MYNVTQVLRESAAASPEARALILPSGRAITYAELERMVNAAGTRLRRVGLREGDSVVLPRENHSMAGVAACIVIGLALARIGVAYSDTLVSGLPFRALLLSAGTRGPVANLPVISFDSSWFEPQAATASVPIAAGGDATLAYLGTSGSTGTRKLMPISHAAMLQRMAVEVLPGLLPGAKPVMMSAKASASWLRTTFNILRLGGTLVLAESGPDCAEFITRFGVTTIFASVGWLQILLPYLKGKPPASVTGLRVSGSLLPPALAEQAMTRLCANLVTGYGATETGLMAIGKPSELRTPYGLGVGRATPGTILDVVDEHGQSLPPGAEGEVRVRTQGMASAYVYSEAPSTTFRDGWFYPGDLGLLTEDGVLVLRGRVSQIINNGAVKIPPRRIEDVLHQFPGVIEAAAFGVPGEDGVPVIWAALVVDRAIDAAALERFCHAKLGPIVAPRAILQMDELPRNAGDKVAEDRLVEIALQQGKVGAWPEALRKR